MKGATKEYDLNSAITFLLVGLGIGSVLAIVFNRQVFNRQERAAPEEFDAWRPSGLQPQPQEEAEMRAA